VTNWVLKLSKLCNLRCSYCYEWNELHNPNRMTIDLIEKIVIAAKDFHKIQNKGQRSAHTTFIIHGGEPFVLPPKYLNVVFDLVRTRFLDLPHTLALQSNMYSVSDDQLELCKKYGVHIGVSYDVMPGVRVTTKGLSSEERAETNTHRARKAGFNPGAVVVLAKHTVSNLTEIYEYFVGQRMPFRVLPLSDGPAERQLDTFSISVQETISAMCDFFDYWIISGRRVAVEPFSTYLFDALNYMLDVPVDKYKRSIHGDYALFVNVDGLLYAERDAYDKALALGDLNTQSMSDILQSSSYKSSLAREDTLIADRCSSCHLNESCAGLHLLATKSRGAFDDPCSIAPAVIKHIAGRLVEWGYDSGTIRNMHLAKINTEPNEKQLFTIKPSIAHELNIAG
jgi:uncharacterized protein